MKISAPHSMTRAFMEREFNSDKLQADPLPEVMELAERIVQLDQGHATTCNAKHMSYNGFITALKAKVIFKEKLWHEKRYPRISIDEDLCVNCGQCTNVCPVKHLLTRNKAILENTGSSCIHCFNCVSDCPKKAIRLIGDLEKGRVFMAKMIARNGNREIPESGVYPLLFEK